MNLNCTFVVTDPPTTTTTTTTATTPAPKIGKRGRDSSDDATSQGLRGNKAASKTKKSTKQTTTASSLAGRTPVILVRGPGEGLIAADDMDKLGELRGAGVAGLTGRKPGSLDRLYA